MTSLQMLFCETYEVLHNLIFKESCWSTGFYFWKHFEHIACIISNKLTNCLEHPEIAVHKRLRVFALEILEYNQGCQCSKDIQDRK